MSLANTLTDYINAAFAGIWVQTSEPDEAEREILRQAAQENWRVALRSQALAAERCWLEEHWLSLAQQEERHG